MQVVHALEKAGWRIAPNQLSLTTPMSELFVDIVARRRVEIGDQEMIVVEVKCFPAGSANTTELYTAIGQYLVYIHMQRFLYAIYEEHFQMTMHYPFR